MSCQWLVGSPLPKALDHMVLAGFSPAKVVDMQIIQMQCLLIPKYPNGLSFSSWRKYYFMHPPTYNMFDFKEICFVYCCGCMYLVWKHAKWENQLARALVCTERQLCAHRRTQCHAVFSVSLTHTHTHTHTHMYDRAPHPCNGVTSVSQNTYFELS